MTSMPSRPPANLRHPLTGRPPGHDPARLAGLLARTWLEVRAGRRPLAQLTPWVAPAVRRRLAAQLAANAMARSGDTIHIRKVVASWPNRHACETCVLVEQAGRTTAIAVRLELHRGAWRAVELTAPEAGFTALPTASLSPDRPIRDAFDEAFEEAGDLPPSG